MTSREAATALALAWRELRSGVRGFGVFLLCLAIGVGAIAAAGSIAQTFRVGLAREARVLAGGDILLSFRQRLVDRTLRAAIAESALATSEIITTDAMARVPDSSDPDSQGGKRSLVDVKAVDDAHPLIGALELEGETDRAALFAPRDGVWGAAVSQMLLDEFNVDVGDRLDVAGASFEIRARIVSEPDELGEGSFWPRLVTSLGGARAMRVAGPGSIFRQSFRLTLEEGADLDAWREAHEEEFRAAGLSVRDRRDATDGLARLFDTLEAFLAVIGLAALVAGGLGVSQATAAFLETRTTSIAALKALGADAGQIRLAYAVQIAALALLGVAMGLVAGAASPWIVTWIAGSRLDLPSAHAVYPRPLFIAAGLGLLAAFMFAAPAIGRARATSPAALFRGALGGVRRTPALELIAAGLCTVAFAALAVATSPRAPMTAMLLFGAGAVFVALAGVSRLVMWLARRAAPRARGFAALAFADLGGPGSIAPIAAPALGLGVAILTLILLVEVNLVRQIRETAPANLPSLAFTQIAAGEGAAFDAVVAEAGAPIDDPELYRRSPVTVARIVGLNGEDITREGVAESERWAVGREINVTRAAARPPELVIEEGDWWPEDYAGPPLVSLEGDVARGLRAGVGDTMTFVVLGREVEAEIANTRTIDWGGFGANFAAVFAPGAIDGANPAETAIVIVPRDQEEAVADAVGARFPRVNVMRVRAALERAGELFDDIALAVNATAAVAAVSGGLVLVGAFAAAARRRAGEAALMKTLGATPGNVLGLFAAEAALAGVLAAALGAAVGAFAAHLIVVNVFEAVWAFPWRATGLVLLGAAGAAGLGGALSAAASLARPAARVLRAG